MDPFDISKLLTWASDGSRTLHFAFAVDTADEKGVLHLDRHHKGKSILHDLVNLARSVDLRSARFGTVTVDAEKTSLNFDSNRRFTRPGLRALQALMKETKMRRYDINFVGADTEGDDGA